MQPSKTCISSAKSDVILGKTHLRQFYSRDYYKGIRLPVMTTNIFFSVEKTQTKQIDQKELPNIVMHFLT